MRGGWAGVIKIIADEGCARKRVIAIVRSPFSDGLERMSGAVEIENQRMNNAYTDFTYRRRSIRRIPHPLARSYRSCSIGSIRIILDVTLNVLEKRFRLFARLLARISYV